MCVPLLAPYASDNVVSAVLAIVCLELVFDFCVLRSTNHSTQKISTHFRTERRCTNSEH